MKNLFDDNEILTKNDIRRSIPLEITPAIQDKLDSLPRENSYQNEALNFQDIGPYQPDKIKQGFTFGQTFKHALPFWNSFGKDLDLNPLSDNTPNGWNAASDENNFIGVIPKYQGYVASATSPNDAYFRRLEVLKLQDEDEMYDNGSLLAKFAGGFVDSLPFAIIPLGQAAKYATLSKSVSEAMLASFPGLAVGNLLHEGSIEARRIGGSLQETLVNTYVDTISGLAFIGGLSGLGLGFDSLKLFNANKFMKFSFSGINAEMKVNNEGKMIGYEAVPTPGINVSAAEVDNAQAFLDSTFAQNGLFAIPKLGKYIEKGVAKVNPIIRGLTSPFETVRGFTDRSASHGLITEGIKRGEAKPEDFETLMGIVQGQNKQYYYQMQKLLDLRNGIDNKLEISNFTERTRKKWTDEGYTDAETFGKEIKEVIISGNDSDNHAVNAAAKITREYLDTTWDQYREVFNLPKDWMPPPTADGYFPRVYNTSLMLERPQEWEDMWVGWSTKADQEIRTAMQPIHDLRAEIDLLKETHTKIQNSGTKEEISASKKELNDARKRLKEMKYELANQIREDRHMFLHAEDHAALSGDESKELKNLFKPLKKIEKERTQANATVKDLNGKAFFLKSKIEASTDKDTISKLKADLKALESEVKVAKDKLSEVKDKYDLEELRLQDLAGTGKISPRLFTRIPDSQRVKFKDPNDILKLRNPFESETMMRAQANALRDTILNQTPEDSLNQVLGSYIGSTSEVPILKRSQMIPDAILQENNFLSNNLPLVVANYRNALHRKISLKQVYGDVTIDGGIQPIVTRLTREFKRKEDALKNNLNLEEEERAKQIKKLKKEFDDAKEFMQLTHNRMMGRTSGSKKTNKFLRFMRLWTASTRLGSVPLSMVTDLSANIYKHGLWPTIRDGLIPALRNIEHRIKTGEGGPYTENLAHAHLGLNTVLSANNDRDWGGIAVEHVPLTGPLGNFMEKAAHISGNLALTNQLQNNLERLAANIIQSKIMRYMIQHQNGSLKEKDLNKLLQYGLDPKEWADRFITNWKAKGYEGDIKGSYQSMYFHWDDVEAANKMSLTIYKGVNDTIIKRGMMDAPFFFDDPLWGTIVFFHGWSTAALTRYLVPLMQRPDAEKIAGTMWMLMAGSLVSPLRRISKGEPAIDEDSNMFKDAFTDSGIFSPIMSIVEDANILTNGAILRGISNDRYRQRSFAGAAGGPVVGVANDVSRILGMMLRGELNETDVKKAGRLIPATQAWYLKGLMNKSIEALGLPKTASQHESSNTNAYRN